jgi:uncharacterized tellurite resistance protein B-like protein
MEVWGDILEVSLVNGPRRRVIGALPGLVRLSPRSYRKLERHRQPATANGWGHRRKMGEDNMLDIMKRFFRNVMEDNAKTTDPKRDHALLVAVCALFVEIARIDETFTQAEMETILAILKEKYGLSKEHADALIAEAGKQLEESVDLWQFAHLINKNYSNEEKITFIETLWQIVFVDGKMDRYERHLMNKLKNLLHLTQEQLIEAKLKALQSR